MPFFRNSSNPQENEAIKLRYLEYVKTHPDNFSDGMVIMTPEKISEVEARRRKFSTRWLIFFIGIILIGSAVSYFGKPPAGEDYIYITLFLFLTILGRQMIMVQFDNVLKAGEMQVVKGVVTAKMFEGKHGNVIISLKSRVRLMEQYNTLSLGDIVQIEILGKDMAVKRKVVVLGKI